MVVIAEEAAGVQVLRGLSGLQPAPAIVAVLTRSANEGAARPVVYEAAQTLGLDVWPSAVRQIGGAGHASSKGEG